MAQRRREGLLVAGGGLAGGLAALGLRKLRPELPLLLVEEGDRLGGGRDILFLEDEVEPEGRSLIEPAVAAAWPGWYNAFPGRSRKATGRVALLSADRLDAMLREALGEGGYRTGTKVVAARGDELLIQGGERIAADGAIDARGAANLSMLELGWRIGTARDYRLAAPHRVDLPVLADSTVDPDGGALRFFQCVPLAEDRLLVEEVRYAAEPHEDAAAAGGRIDAYLALRGWKEAGVLGETSSLLPAPWDGDFDAFWRVGGARVAKLGLRGGFFHPLSGSALGDAVRNALLLARQPTFSGAALNDLFEVEAKRLWKRREPLRAFTGRLFAAGPEGGRDLLGALLASDPALIGRFAAGEAGLIDRLRLGRLGR